MFKTHDQAEWLKFSGPDDVNDLGELDEAIRGIEPVGRYTCFKRGIYLLIKDESTEAILILPPSKVGDFLDEISHLLGCEGNIHGQVYCARQMRRNA